MKQYIRVLWLPVIIEGVNYASPAPTFVLSAILAFCIGFMAHRKFTEPLWMSALLATAIPGTDLVVAVSQILFGMQHPPNDPSGMNMILGFSIFAIMFSVVAALIGVLGGFTSSKIPTKNMGSN